MKIEFDTNEMDYELAKKMLDMAYKGTKRIKLHTVNINGTEYEVHHPYGDEVVECDKK